MSSPDRPLVEPIYIGVSTLVYRAQRASDGVPVVVKRLRPEAATQAGALRLRREYDLLAALDVPGVVRVLGLEDHQGCPAIVMEDIGAEDLHHLLGRTKLALPTLLALAGKIAGALAALHRQGLIHQAVNPGHIVFNPATEEVRLIGFGLAAESPRHASSQGPLAAIDEALAYISPEQTGRMNRPLDYRTDFYSLGVTLYRAFCGRHPFVANDALGMVHSHIATLPPAPCEVDPEIPASVSRIIMRLLAKMPEDRYQSGHGLRVDLERCRAGLSSAGTVPDFEPGQEDVPEQLRIPNRLYGREREAGQLLAAFDWACAGSGELFLVVGPPGTGKTALVHEIHRPVLERRGYFIEGKLDALQRSVPYSVWTQAFAGFVSCVLTEGEAQLARWRQAILQAIGGLGRVLTEMIPSLELVIGKQPQVPRLDATEAQNRFNRVFLALAGAIAGPEHPLVVFLDDLQWIDGASLRLLQNLLGPGRVPNLLVIGAYRDNEVDALHRLAKGLEAMQRDQAPIEQLTLGQIGEEPVNQLVADTLHCEPARSAPLARMLHAKTGGNPFFLRQTMRSLVERQAVSFDAKERRWRWDLAAIRRREITDNVAALTVERIGQLPPTTQRLLSLAACIGFRFDLSALSAVADASTEAILDELEPAVREMLITGQGEQYEFVHNRVWEAAYAIIPAGDRPAQHLRIGRRLVDCTPEEMLGESIFEIVGHLNRGVDLITCAAEREQLAALNLLAGRRAKAAAAFAPAAEYFAAGTALLGVEGWGARYDLASALLLEQAECEALTGNHDHSETLLMEALDKVRSMPDRALAYRLRLRLYQLAGRFQEAATVALEALRCFGFSFPETDEEIAAATDEEIHSVSVNLHGRCIADLAGIPLTDDPEAGASIGLLEEVMPLYLAIRPQLWVLINTRGVNLCLQQGHVDESPFIYSGYAMILAGVVRDIPAAIEFSEMAIALNERLPNTAAWKGKLLFHHGAIVNIWGRHFRENLPLLDEAFRASLDAGDLANAGYLTYNAIWLHFENGDPLPEVASIAHDFAQFARQNRNAVVYNVDRIEQQFASCLMGKTRSQTDFSDSTFDEEECVAAIDQSGFRLGTICHCILKLVVAYLAGEYETALDWADRAAPALCQVTSMACEVTYHFYRALTLAALHDQVCVARQRQFRSELAEILDRLGDWTNHCPPNFASRLALVSAEVARLDGRVEDAMGLYERAIASARTNGFVHTEAVAYETAAAFYRRRGYEAFARTYLSEAVARYTRWGAQGKVRQLESRDPWLARTGQAEAPTLAERVDAVAVAKAQRAISGEIRLERLAQTLLRIVMENAGAQKGMLFMEGAGRLRAVTEHDDDGSQRLVFGVSPSDADFPEAIVNYVRRSRETVALDDASADAGPFSADDYLRRTQSRSVLCLPIQRQEKLLAVLCLENNLVAGAFTAEHRQVLEVLAAQAAISLETSCLYETLQASEERWRVTLEQAQIGIFDWDVANDVWDASPVHHTMLGFAPGKGPADRKEWLSRVHPDDRLAVDKKIQEVLAGTSPAYVYEYEARFLHADGGYRWQHVKGFAVQRDPAGRVTRMLGIRTDITERKRAEAELRESERRLAQAQRIAHVGSWERDLDAGTITLSEEACRIFGLSPEEVPRGLEAWHPRWLELIHPDDQRHAGEAAADALRGGPPYDVEYRVVRPDGAVRFVHSEAVVERDEKGRPRSMLGVMQDITDRTRAEQEVLRLNQELERRIVERTAQLEGANRELEAFAYSVSHDLRAPLRHIDAFVGLLGKHVAETAGSDARRYMASIGKAARRMGQLIDDLLSFSRMGQAEIARDRVELAGLVREVISDLAPDVADRDVRWQVADLPAVIGDRTLLRTVLANLLANALKFTRPRDTAEIEIGWEDGDGGETVVFVRDNGVGFDPDYAGKLFGVFQRLHRTEEFEGTGIGLANVSRIVARHGGRTWATGVVDRGATFYFSLPAAPAGG